MTGLEPFLTKAGEAIAGLVIKTGWEMANIRLDESVKQLIFRASRQYAQNYRDRHGILKVLGMREPVLLDAVYTTVEFLDNNTLKYFDSLEGLEQAYRDSKQRKFRFDEPERRAGIAVANQTQYLMVLGGPGMGKSTFLRKVGLEAVQGKQEEGFQHQCLPVFIELKAFRSNEIDIKAAISSEFEICGFPEYERFTERMLEAGKLLILLDGLDEVPTDRRDAAITKIQDFVDRYSTNRFIASCRVAAYRHNFRRFTDVGIADFDDEQIKSFITQWFRNDPVRSQECWEKLSSQEYVGAKELTHTPLLLTLICLLYQRSGQFPTNRATLYERAVRVLLEEWAGEKGLPHEVIYKGLDTKRKELMLSEIAYEAFRNDQLFLPKRAIASQIERILQDMLPDEKFINGADVLRSIEEQHGLLVERTDNIYSFSHLTVQEFLTAQQIVQDHRKVTHLVKHHLTDDHWKEVFLLIAGLNKADDLLLQMEEQAQTLVTRSAVKNLLQWADQMTADSEGAYNPAAKRSVVVYAALAFGHTLDLALYLVRSLNRAFDFAYALAHTLDLAHALALGSACSHALAHTFDFGYDLAQRLEESRICKRQTFTPLIARLEVLRTKSRETLSASEAAAIREQIRQLWFTALKLPPERELAQADIKELTYYLQANWLMVQCRQAAVQVTQKTWAEIEHRMLRII